jgi:hypothetical protein
MSHRQTQLHLLPLTEKRKEETEESEYAEVQARRQGSNRMNKKPFHMSKIGKRSLRKM